LFKRFIAAAHATCNYCLEQRSNPAAGIAGKPHRQRTPADGYHVESNNWIKHHVQHDGYIKSHAVELA
jgi:hypothetical protein